LKQARRRRRGSQNADRSLFIDDVFFYCIIPFFRILFYKVIEGFDDHQPHQGKEHDMSNNDVIITITIAGGKVSMVSPEKVAQVATAPARKAAKRGSYVIHSKRRCLNILRQRSHVISPARLANMVGISVGATHNCIYLLRRDGWDVQTVKGGYKLA
jgi:biotin operon repressor